MTGNQTHLPLRRLDLTKASRIPPARQWPTRGLGRGLDLGLGEKRALSGP